MNNNNKSQKKDSFTSNMSAFLFLKQKNKVLKQDKQKYQQTNSTLYKKQGFKFLYLVLLAKLCDMGNLPVPKQHKLVAYLGSIITISSISFYRSSLQFAQLLNQLDQKYQKQFQKVIKETGFQGIV